MGAYTVVMNKVVGMLALALLTLASAQEPYLVGGWTVQQRTDPFSDQNSSIMALRAENTSQFGSEGSLAIMCTPGAGFDGITVMATGDVYISETTTPVTYRVDADEVVRERWLVSEVNVTPYLENRHRAFIRAIASGSELAMRWTGYSRTVTYEFQLHGVRDALSDLGCHSGDL